MDNNRSSSNYWDQAAGNKTFTVSLDFPRFSSLTRPDMDILDFGCGYGRTLAELDSHGYKNLYGCDFSPAMLELAAAKTPRAALKLNRGSSIPFSDRTFDAVILLAVLTSICSNNEQLALIAEIRRVLRPDGIVYVGDFLINSDERNLARYKEYCGPLPYGVFTLPEGVTLRHHDPAWIDTLFKDFTPLLRLDTVHKTMNQHSSSGFLYAGRNISQ